MLTYDEITAMTLLAKLETVEGRPIESRLNTAIFTVLANMDVNLGELWKKADEINALT